LLTDSKLGSALLLVAVAGSLAAPSGCSQPTSDSQQAASAQDGQPNAALQIEPLAQFREPWAMTFLPDGGLLVTEKRGRLVLWRRGAEEITVGGGPAIDYDRGGGLGDVVLHPAFASNRLVYLSFVELGEGDVRGAAVGRARLAAAGGRARLENWAVIWRQSPKVAGAGHYSHRIAFAPDGRLFVTSGERRQFNSGEGRQFDPRRDPDTNLGSIVRLNDDGSIPDDNPFRDQGGVAAQVWSFGHRNVLGIAFAPDGRLWIDEMGPAGGDELNLVTRGANYGWPIVSNGDHYNGRPIPRHATRPDLLAPKLSWNPVISPAGMIIYTGERFPAWRGQAIIGGLSSRALIRVRFDGDAASEAGRHDMGERIREVEQAPDGAFWVLEDQREPGETGGRLLRLTPG